MVVFYSADAGLAVQVRGPRSGLKRAQVKEYFLELRGKPREHMQSFALGLLCAACKLPPERRLPHPFTAIRICKLTSIGIRLH